MNLKKKTAHSVKESRVVKKPEERKNELLDIALKLFMQKGYENTSVKDIYTEAKGSFGMFYHHFKSKEEIFSQAMDKFAALFTGKLSSILLDREVPYTDRYNAFLKHYIEFLKGRDKVSGNKFGKIDILVFRTLNFKLLSESIHPIELFIEEGKEKGILLVENVHHTAVFLIYGIWGNIYEEAKRTGSNKNAKNILSQLSNFIPWNLKPETTIP